MLEAFDLAFKSTLVRFRTSASRNRDAPDVRFEDIVSDLVEWPVQTACT